MYEMSTGSKREREQRRKLQLFLTDLALLGSLQGWRSPGFAVSAASSYSSSSTTSSSSSAYSLASHASNNASPSSHANSPLPEGPGARRPQPSTLYTPRPLSQANRDHSSEAHLLPASPSEREIAVPEVNCTLFLLAGYAKYGRPYAWIRSNHERLVNIGGTDALVKDTPMKLKSVTDWQTQGIRIWDVVSELVCLCTVPSPSNPLALDMRYLKSLPLTEGFLVTGALLNFLEMYAVHGNRDELHYDKVIDEVKSLRRLHVQTLLEVQRQRGTTRPASSPTTGASSEDE